jgi:hypothetical protein
MELTLPENVQDLEHQQQPQPQQQQQLDLTVYHIHHMTRTEKARQQQKLEDFFRGCLASENKPHPIKFELPILVAKLLTIYFE